MAISRDQIIGQLTPLFERILEIPAFTPELDMAEVETWNSLAHIQILAAIEEEFGIAIGFEDAVEMITGQAILEKIAKYFPI